MNLSKIGHLKLSEQLKNEKDVNTKQKILDKDKLNCFEKHFKGSDKYDFVEFCKETCSEDFDVKHLQTYKDLPGEMLIIYIKFKRLIMY